MQHHAPDRPRQAVSHKLPPGPGAWPLVGHLPDFAGDILAFFTNSAREYGDVVALRAGTWPALLLSNPDDIEHVLVKNHRNFIKNRFFWRQVSAIFGTGLLTSEGDAWARQRRLAAPAFSGQRLASYGEVMVQQTRTMIAEWAPGEVRDLHVDMMTLTLRIAAKTLFNADMMADVAEIDHATTALTDEIASRFSRPFVIPDWVPLPGHVRYRRGLKQIEALVHRLVQEHRSRPCDNGGLLSTLMMEKDENGNPMSEEQVRDQAITLLLAGHETTALALSWTWYLLGQHPDIEAQLASEVAAVLGDRPATVEDLPRLAVTETIVTEAMRLYPPAWAIGREAVADCEIGGYAVPAGTTIYMCPWIVHRDRRHFAEPDAFRPERWRDDAARHLPRFAYFPFGGGPRICIGNRFAMMEAMLILVTMVQRCRLELQRQRPVVPFPSITLRPKGGVWVRVGDRHAD